MPVIGANTVLGLAALIARAWTAWASVNVPLTRRPVAVGLGSATVSAASPAELVTVAATVAS